MMADKKSGIEERLNSPMRIFIGGKLVGESDSDKAEAPDKDRLKKLVDKKKK